ncbi:MAG: hypothetical protein PHF37_10295 [Phycisphaerae bacterium]|nr:hypothetical protein [Phycisphaerae bacterium]
MVGFENHCATGSAGMVIRKTSGLALRLEAEMLSLNGWALYHKFEKIQELLPLKCDLQSYKKGCISG